MQKMCNNRKLFASYYLKQKEQGSSLYLMIPSILLIIVILILMNTYLRAADVVEDNFKTSLDAATLAATVVDLDWLVQEDKISIIGETSDSTILASDEENMVRKRFATFEKTLQSNIGLREDFTFEGGTCGWAANLLVANKIVDGLEVPGSLIIDSFIIYEIVNTNVYSYTVSNITEYTSLPIVNKSLVGTVTKDTNNNILTSTATTPEGTPIMCPTIYATASFPIEPPGFANLDWVDYESVTGDEEIANFVKGGKYVSRSSTTGLKSN